MKSSTTTNKAPISSTASNSITKQSTTSSSKVSSVAHPLKKNSSTSSTITTKPSSTTTASSVKKAIPSTKYSGVTSTSSTTSQKTRNISPTKRTMASKSSVSSKLGKTTTEKQPSTTAKIPQFELTADWLHSLLMDINLDHSIPFTNIKHPNHQFIKSKDETFIKDMDDCLPYSIDDGERKMAPCDKSGIQLDGHYTTGHNVHFVMQSEKFSFFSWTLIMRAYVDEKSSCLFSFGPWYR